MPVSDPTNQPTNQPTDDVGLTGLSYPAGAGILSESYPHCPDSIAVIAENLLSGISHLRGGRGDLNYLYSPGNDYDGGEKASPLWYESVERQIDALTHLTHGGTLGALGVGEGIEEIIDHLRGELAYQADQDGKAEAYEFLEGVAKKLNQESYFEQSNDHTNAVLDRAILLKLSELEGQTAETDAERAKVAGFRAALLSERRTSHDLTQLETLISGYEGELEERLCERLAIESSYREDIEEYPDEHKEEDVANWQGASFPTWT